MHSSAFFFTAAEIARALSCSTANIRQALLDSAAAGERIVAGNLANAWRIESFPEVLVAQLDRRAVRLGFASAYQLLRNAPAGYKSELPLSQVAPAEVEAAHKLRSALGMCLQLPVEYPITELARVAAPEYRRAFGYSVSDRHLRELITRTISRDGGNRNFARLEIYLAERPKKYTSPSAIAGADSLGFAELDEALSVVENRENPSASDVAYCWRKLVACYSERVEAGASAKAVKKALRVYIVKAAPFLGDTADAVKRNLNRKIQLALDEGVCGIIDRRKSLEARSSSAATHWEGAVNQFSFMRGIIAAAE